MTTSVQLTAPHGSAGSAFDRLGRLPSALADSPEPATESDFHKLLKQGEAFSDDTDEPSTEDSGASRNSENTGSDPDYLFSGGLDLAPSRAAGSVPVEQPNSQGNIPVSDEKKSSRPSVKQGSAKAQGDGTGSSAPVVGVPEQVSSIDTNRLQAAAKDWSIGAGDPGMPKSDVPANVTGKTQANTPPSSLTGGTAPQKALTSDKTPIQTSAKRWAWKSSSVKPETSKSDSQASASLPAAVLPSKATASQSAPAPVPISKETSTDQANENSASTATGSTGATQASQPKADAEQAIQSQAQDALEAAVQSSTEPVVFDSIPLELVSPRQPEAARSGQRNSSPQPTLVPGADVAPTPELISLSPAPDVSSNEKAPADALSSSKPAQANAPDDWNVDNDAPRTDAGGTSTDPVAFEAKLTLEPVAPTAAVTAVESLSPLSASKSIATAAEETNSVPEVKPEVLFKTELPAPIAAAVLQSDARPAPVAQLDAPVATQMQATIEAPVTPSPSNHAVTINLREMADEAQVNLRFVERGGEIHVSVRTSDAELTQDLRGGLNDLTGRLEHAGIRTEISTLSASEPNTQRDAQQPPSEQRGSGRQSQDSQREQRESRKNNPSGWREAIEDSTGATASTNQEQNL